MRNVHNLWKSSESGIIDRMIIKLVAILINALRMIEDFHQTYRVTFQKVF